MHQMQLGEPGADGRRRPSVQLRIYVEADTVFAAVGGRRICRSYLRSALERTQMGNTGCRQKQPGFNVPEYSPGDTVFGPDMVIEAIAAGRRGALAIINTW